MRQISFRREILYLQKFFIYSVKRFAICSIYKVIIYST